MRELTELLGRSFLSEINGFEENFTEEQKKVIHKIVTNFAGEIQRWVVENYSRAVQDWIVDEYSPEIQEWLTTELGPTILKRIYNKIKDKNKNERLKLKSLRDSLREKITE